MYRYSHHILYESYVCLLSLIVNRFASIVPEILCHAHEMAHGTTAIGLVATKKVIARFVPRPAFCMPTSMLIVRFLAVLKWKRVPAV